MDKRARLFKILEIAQNQASKHESWEVRSRIKDIQFYFNGYAEPGYNDDVIVATGNWNTVTKYVNNQHTIISDIPSRLQEIFEKLGVECKWSDEWTTCNDCGKLVRTSPNSYSWLPSFVQYPDGISCHECVKEHPSYYLEFLEGNTNNANVLDIDLTEHGYVKVYADYQTGWHPGQTDDPRKIARELDAKGVCKFIFQIDGTGQFDTNWSVYVHEDEVELLNEVEEETEEE